MSSARKSGEQLQDLEDWIDKVPSCPEFFPTLEEFKDPMAYIEKIAPIGRRYGLAKIVPPASWKPEMAVDFSSLSFATRIQNISKLQRTTSARKMKRAKKPFSALDKLVCEVCSGGHRDDVMLLCDSCGKGYHTFCLVPALASIPKGDWHCKACLAEGDEFGFEVGKTYSYTGFTRIAEMFKSQYFEGRNSEQVPLRDIELEFWRIVEGRAREVEVLYGSDLDTDQVGSGFPKLNQNNKKGSNKEEYLKHPWNLNNFARAKGSLLSAISSDITGVTVPWLYIGMLFSAFCWHNEDHYMYSVNYHHKGAVKTWYGVPGPATNEFEKAMQECMPSVFAAHPDLLFQLVTMLSPRELMKKNVPICRAQQGPRDFIITFPAAYHCGFSNGVNCTEAVNFATPDWLPYGFESVVKYRQYHRMPVFSHSELVIECASNIKQADLTVNAARYLLAELNRIRESEKQDRAKLRMAQLQGMAVVRCVMDLGEGVVDSLRGRNCVICQHQLFLSGVSCECRSGKFACLSHAEQLCSCEPRKRCLHIRFTLNELDNVANQFSPLVPLDDWVPESPFEPPKSASRCKEEAPDSPPAKRPRHAKPLLHSPIKFEKPDTDEPMRDAGQQQEQQQQQPSQSPAKLEPPKGRVFEELPSDLLSQTARKAKCFDLWTLPKSNTVV